MRGMVLSESVACAAGAPRETNLPADASCTRFADESPCMDVISPPTISSFIGCSHKSMLIRSLLSLPHSRQPSSKVKPVTDDRPVSLRLVCMAGTSGARSSDT